MTQNDRQKASNRLLDSIGLIDDRYIYEAETPFVQKKKRAWLKTFIIAAVSLTLALMLALTVATGGLITAIVIIMGNEGTKDDSPIISDGDNMDEGNSSATSYSLSSQMVSIKDKTEHLAVSSQELDLFDGASVIWKYSDESDYRVYKLTSAEAAELSERLSRDIGIRVTRQETTELEGIWICNGEGQVISPCLERSEGNVSFGQLFDYSAEYEPSEEFSDYLCDVIS